MSFFGIRGIGSFYYLAYALNQREFPAADELWALVALVVVISIFAHGILVTPALRYVEKIESLRKEVKTTPAGNEFHTTMRQVS